MQSNAVMSQRQKSLLIVDDSPVIMAIVRSCVKNIDANIQLASSFEQGLDIVSTQAIDLLFTDYHLDNGHTGDNIIRQCRRNPASSHARCYLMTADLPDDFRSLRTQLGIRGCLIKPLKPEKFSRLMELLIASPD